MQQARITADPSYYSRAEKALRRSLTLEPKRNWQAMTGMGALANAGHTFREGLRWGRKARQVNPHNGSVHGHFDPLQAPYARTLLDSVGGRR
ncbi:MAG: hypothetical protein ACRDT8_10545 [Micromonosporaceae bacterium]